MKEIRYRCDKCDKDISNLPRYKIEVSMIPSGDTYGYHQKISNLKSPVELCGDCYEKVKIVI